MKTILTTIFVLLSFVSFSQIKETIVQMKTWTTPFIENYNANQLVRVKDDSILYSLRYSETSGKTMLYLKNNNRLKTIGSSSYWLANGTSIYYNAGKVGIGSTETPDSTFQVTGGAKFTNDVLVNGVTVGISKRIGLTSTNTVVGKDALKNMTTGEDNTMVGALAGGSITSGEKNTATGYRALMSNTTGNRNSSYGLSSSSRNTTGSNHAVIGYNAMYYNTTGYSNTAVGVSALYSNTTASNLVAVGDSALYSNVTGAGNVAVGSKALKSTIYGYNTAIGHNSLINNYQGNYNTAIGYNSGYSSNNGGGNVFVGRESGYSNTTGYDNMMAGAYSGYYNSTGYKNTFIGVEAGFNNTTHSNTFIGSSASKANTNGGYNTSIGTQSGLYNVTGSRNIFIGYKAGAIINGGTSQNNTTNKSIYIGNNTRTLLLAQTNEIVIGDTAFGHGSNTTTIGNTTTTDTYLAGALRVDSIPNEASPDSILVVENGLIKKNSTAIGAFAYLPSSDTTGIGTANTYYRIKGTFTTSPMSKFSVVSTPAIRYDGGDTRYFEIHWNATISSNHNGCTVKCGIKKGGTLVSSSVMSTYAKTAGELYNLAGVCVIQLSTNDEVQLVVTADTNGDIITFHNYTTSIRLFY